MDDEGSSQITAAPEPDRPTESRRAPRDPEEVGAVPLEQSRLDPARYAVECELGRGGMGTVDRVVDRVLVRHVALKRLLPNATPTQSRHFIEEARITGKLDHPNIVPVYDLGLRDSEVVFTMKEVSGTTLQTRIKDLHAGGFEPRTLEVMLRMFLKVCDGIGFAHSRGVVHRDLKPANILIGNHGQVYVMDWGVALELESAARSPDDFAGTPAYMAPEQARRQGEQIDERTDVFGLGAILYEIITGCPPNDAPTIAETLSLAREERLRDPRSRLPASQPIPEGLCEIVSKALASLPANRYPSVDALRADIEQFLRGGGWFATKHFAPGEVIVREGDAADLCYIIVSGTCEVYYERQGGHHTLRQLQPGDVFGETAIFTSERRTASVRAVDEVTTKVVTMQALRRELDMGSWLGAFVRQLTTRFLELDEKLRKRQSS